MCNQKNADGVRKIMSSSTKITLMDIRHILSISMSAANLIHDQYLGVYERCMVRVTFKLKGGIMGVRFIYAWEHKRNKNM